VSDGFWSEFLIESSGADSFGIKDQDKDLDPVVIEYSSPNTNKPLHLGHIRNNLLGWSIAEILKANGKNVVKVNLVNDRGIHICKTMLAWMKMGNNETPEARRQKGDKFVGEYYVKFEKAFKGEVEELKKQGFSEEEATKKAPLIIEAQDLLIKWEEGDKEVRSLWEMMNNWVYAGFDETYRRLGIEFDKIYYESETYLLGKDIIKEGLKEGVLYQKEDGSVWADLSDEGLDEKLLLRADETSVYITQDIGTAQLRYDKYHPEKLLYVVGNEQNYHFDVLKHVLKKLGRKWAEDIIHINYGMVELPSGKMKSREGTVVDADDLMDEMLETARNMTMELGKIKDIEGEEAKELFRIVSLGALKYFILKVDPKKNMLFNPEESVDFNGNTGPFIQYTYARIQSLLRKAREKRKGEGEKRRGGELETLELKPKEKDIIKLLYSFPSIVKEAGDNYSPALIANYIYELAREYNQFYQELPVLREPDQNKANLRLVMSEFTGKVIKSAMGLLGIEVPEKM
jgi:arginyl-tRNA synthetase